MITTLTPSSGATVEPVAPCREVVPAWLWPAAGAGALAAAVAMPWLVNGYFISLAATALVMAVLAMSAQVLVGLAGLPPLGQAAHLTVGAYTAATIATLTSLGPVQLVAAAAAGAVAAALTGLLAVRARGTTFLMVTFGVGELVHAGASRWAPGGSEGVHTPPVVALPGLPAMTRPGWIYLYVLACTLLIGAAVAVLVRTRFALLLRGIAAHEPRVQAAGHHPRRLLLAAYTFAGGIAGAAGALSIAVTRYVSPADAAMAISALALAAALIGSGSMTGACAGAILLVAARDWAGGLLAGHGPTLLGLCFLLLAYLPRHRLAELTIRLLRRRA
ncbi:branched-chain amino acid ABC transporter permease [Micromonospora craniellae]|uniref:Branched-chain amino acid ABC transporter permease n=1 Tax=Micromonospora craniellae TaxID=2294034 RepID=A0A372FQS4_9ACTN|nr:branched-chain amino acid ABC transporter permease [Micromonospora craniellae]QOC93904.1 branched-chain amino acid ABC transporter permease [Micromonospora craniellae]RFS41039.1 branched-chain amino acid ABC transporter permease [Micromonospora craniellae]